MVLLIRFPPSVSTPVCSCCPAPNRMAATCEFATWSMWPKNRSTLSSWQWLRVLFWAMLPMGTYHRTTGRPVDSAIVLHQFSVALA
ncbi:hypothetical protein P3T35_001156 [Kitasatospora sp. GP30]|nr:hypothetical protein [Kitasatospora sp. GP30]